MVFSFVNDCPCRLRRHGIAEPLRDGEARGLEFVVSTG
jgi:hypothetical protein